MTKTMTEFANPNFIALVTAAAKILDLPAPIDSERKLFMTTLGTRVCTTSLNDLADLVLED